MKKLKELWDKVKDSIKKVIEWIYKIKDYVLIFILVLFILFMMLLIALVSNWVFTEFEICKYTIPSVLGYKDACNLVPVYLSLSVAIIIALIQNKIQKSIHMSDENSKRIEQRKYEINRTSDLTKKYFYFSDYIEFSCLGGNLFCIIFNFASDTLKTYFKVKPKSLSLFIDGNKLNPILELNHEYDSAENLNISFRVDGNEADYINQFIIKSILGCFKCLTIELELDVIDTTNTSKIVSSDNVAKDSETESHVNLELEKLKWTVNYNIKLISTVRVSNKGNLILEKQIC